MHSKKRGSHSGQNAHLISSGWSVMDMSPILRECKINASPSQLYTWPKHAHGLAHITYVYTYTHTITHSHMNMHANRLEFQIRQKCNYVRKNVEV